jgi:hypothetical protein
MRCYVVCITLIVILNLALTAPLNSVSAADQASSEAYTIQEVNTGGVAVLKIKLKVDDDVFIVSGRLERPTVRQSYRGQVYVVIVAPDGALLEWMITKGARPFFGRSKRIKTSFKARFQSVPPEGSTIFVTYYEGEPSIGDPPKSKAEEENRKAALEKWLLTI